MPRRKTKTIRKKSSWATTILNNWNDVALYAEIAVSAGSPFGPSYVYRGQANEAWGLTSSLQRTLPITLSEREARVVEENLLYRFQTHAHLAFNVDLRPDESDLVFWWALMQQYGAPTRLLDWTASPYVALYFACASHLDCDGVVWTVQPSSINKYWESKAYKKLKSKEPTTDVNDVLRKDNPPLFLYFFPSQRPSDRMASQQGHYSVSSRMLVSHGDLVTSACAPNKLNSEGLMHGRWIVPANRKLEYMTHLRSLNVTGASLFPGSDGLGREMSELAMLSRLHFEDWRAGRSALHDSEQ